MRNKHFSFLLTAVLTGLILLGNSPCQAIASENTYVNKDSGYEARILDEADLLTAEEEALLLTEMEKITQYGHVAFVSCEENPSYSTEIYAEDLFYQWFGSDSGTIFLIDMDYRYIWIYSDGDIYETITDAYADSITDNVYSYASQEDYYTCVSRAFSQITSLLEGKWIAQPMKWICNGILAIMIALIINYFVAMFLSRSKEPSLGLLLSGMKSNVSINNARRDFVRQSKRYSPQSSGSGGGGSGRSGGGGGGGGGGHRF